MQHLLSPSAAGAHDAKRGKPGCHRGVGQRSAATPGIASRQGQGGRGVNAVNGRATERNTRRVPCDEHTPLGDVPQTENPRDYPSAGVIDSSARVEDPARGGDKRRSEGEAERHQRLEPRPWFG
jgi:hypothetical protein